MGIVSGIVVYLIIWWTALFMVLPFGVERKHQGGPEGGIQGAPDFAGMKKKLLVTTILSLVIWGIVYMLIASDVISFREMARSL